MNNGKKKKKVIRQRRREREKERNTFRNALLDMLFLNDCTNRRKQKRSSTFKQSTLRTRLIISERNAQITILFKKNFCSRDRLFHVIELLY